MKPDEAARLAREIADKWHGFPKYAIQLAKLIAPVILATDKAAYARGVEAAALYHERKAEIHAADAKWMGPNREYLAGARIPGASMSPMNGPAIAHDREMSHAAAIRAFIPAR